MRRFCLYIDESVRWREFIFLCGAVFVWEYLLKPLFIDVEQRQKMLYYVLNRPVLTLRPLDSIAYLFFHLIATPVTAFLLIYGFYNIVRATIMDYSQWLHELLGEPGGVPRPTD